MGWVATPFALLGLGATAVSAVLVVPAWRHRSDPGAWPFLGMMLALSAWSLCYAVQYGAESPRLLWHRLGLVAGGFVPPLWLVFCLQYSGRGELATRRGLAALALEPLAFAVVAVANPRGLLWEGATVTRAGGAYVADVVLGNGYFVHYAFAYLLLGGGFALLVSVFVRGSTLSRTQTGLLLLGAVPPVIANTAFTFDLDGGALPGFDVTPFAFVVTAVLFGLALYRFDLLERAPIARRHLINEMGDGLVVLDGDDEVVEANATARAVLDPTPTEGGSIAFDGGEASTAAGARRALDGRTLTATVDGKQRAYDVECSPLTEHAGRVAGHVVAFRDVTQRTQYEQRLEVAQRVLRHNLRNDLTVVRGWAERLSETVDDEKAATGAECIVDTVDDLVDLSEKTRTMVQMDEYDTGDRQRVDAADAVTDVVASFRTDHPDATVDCDVPESLPAWLPNAAFVTVAVENLVENAIEHNDCESPWVSVSAERDGGEVRIRVADDGPEIPPMERRVIHEGAEEALTHGSGIGLWLSYWSVTRVGGDVDFETRPGGGNVVTVAVPAPPTAE